MQAALRITLCALCLLALLHLYELSKFWRLIEPGGDVFIYMAASPFVALLLNEAVVPMHGWVAFIAALIMGPATLFFVAVFLTQDDPPDLEVLVFWGGPAVLCPLAVVLLCIRGVRIMRQNRQMAE